MSGYAPLWGNPGGARRRLAMSLAETDTQIVQVGRADLVTVLNWLDGYDERIAALDAIGFVARVAQLADAHERLGTPDDQRCLGATVEDVRVLADVLATSCEEIDVHPMEALFERAGAALVVELDAREGTR